MSTYTGIFPTLTLVKSNKEVIEDSITWAKKIAKSKNFHYGKGRHAHHNGCYYCGSQPKSKQKAGIKKWKKTYCCNPFVHAAFAHGGCVPEMLKLCRKGKSYGFSTSEGYAKSKLFKKVSRKSIERGDVLCSDGHVALYIGGGKVIHAGNEDDNVIGSKLWIKSIGIGKWKGYKRAYRYIGSVDKKMSIRHGEYSERVKHLQEFLNWWGSFGLSISGLFNDKTLKAVKEFQRSVGIKATGKVDTKTVAAMKSASRQDSSQTVEKTIAEKTIDACKVQAEWMKNFTYKWQSNPTVSKSKKYGTCVTYVACVLQRIGILESGRYIWIDTKGKVIGANSKMEVTYLKGTLRSNKSKFKKGDIVIGGNGKVDAGAGSHIFILTGKWDSDGNPYIYDQNSANRVRKGKNPKYLYKGSFKTIARIRPVWIFRK